MTALQLSQAASNRLEVFPIDAHAVSNRRPIEGGGNDVSRLRSKRRAKLRSALFIEATRKDAAGAVIGTRTRVHYDSLHREIAKEAEAYDGWTRTITGYDQLGMAAANWGPRRGTMTLAAACRQAVLCAGLLAPSLSGVAATQMHAGLLKYVYPQGSGGTIVLIYETSPSTCPASGPEKYIYVQVGSNGVDATGAKNIYAAALTALLARRTFKIVFDDASARSAS